MDFVVKRSEWYRGRGGRYSRLLVVTKRCCLGFVAQQCGIEDKDLMKNATPGQVGKTNETFPTNFYSPYAENIEMGPGWIMAAMRTNDDQDITDPIREEQLKSLFVANGHTISFVD